MLWRRLEMSSQTDSLSPQSGESNACLTILLKQLLLQRSRVF